MTLQKWSDGLRSRWDAARARRARNHPSLPAPRTAFVLAGGGSRGAVQVGMLDALCDRGIRPDRVFGASVGAINGAAYAGDPTKEGIEAMAKEKGCTPSQLTLAWLLAQGPDVVAIPGTRYSGRLDENLGALSVRLTEAEVVRMSAAVPTGAAAGTRYPAGGMKGVFI